MPSWNAFLRRHFLGRMREDCAPASCKTIGALECSSLSKVLVLDRRLELVPQVVADEEDAKNSRRIAAFN